MRFKFAALLAGAFLFLTVPAFAVPVSFCAPGSYGPTDVGASVTANGLTATGWQGTSTTTMNTATDLSCKDQGSNEFGLGIFSDSDGEINTHNFVQISGLAGATLTVIESVQGGEGFELFGSNDNGVLGTSLLGSGTGCGTCTLTVHMDDFAFLDVTASSGNVLLDNVSTPEPGTYLLMGTGLLMLGLFMRRKFASASC